MSDKEINEMNIVQLVVDSYNKALFDAFENALSQMTSEEFEKVMETEGELGELTRFSSVDNAVKVWSDEVIEEIGKSPREAIAEFGVDEILQSLQMFAEESDYGYPTILKEHISENKDIVQGILVGKSIELINNFNGLTAEQGMALMEYCGLLASWDCTELISPLLDVYYTVKSDDFEKFELLSDCIDPFKVAAIDELKKHIEEKVDELETLEDTVVKYVKDYNLNPENLNKIQNKPTEKDEDYEYVEELLLKHRECEQILGYQLAVMAYICKENGHKDEEVYKLLKRCFKAFELRIIPTICLVDYGDWRAITMLRTAVEKEGTEMQEEELREILCAIINLGGDITGLPGADEIGVSSLPKE